MPKPSNPLARCVWCDAPATLRQNPQTRAWVIACTQYPVCRWERPTGASAAPIYYTQHAFSIDDDPTASFTGWTDGQRWNGFACPLFERDEAQRMVDAYATGALSWSGPPEEGYAAGYEAATDSFWFYNPSVGARDAFSGTDIILPDGRPVHVYPIGAAGWIWMNAPNR